MSARSSTGGGLIAAVLLGSAVTVGAVVMLAQANPESPLRRYVDVAEGVARDLPGRTRAAIQEAKARFAEAKAAFVAARAESERSLQAQLQEAKQRGSLPPA